MIDNKEKIIAISGAHGFIGSNLKKALEKSGYQVIAMVRKKNTSGIYYNYETGEIDLDKLKECYAVIHLAGENIFARRWTNNIKKAIYDSRIKSTDLIAKSLSKLADKRERVFICASAIGIYGDRKDELITEESSLGDGFLAKTCRDWEKASNLADHDFVRVVNIRIAPVLGLNGGILSQLTPIFRLGLGIIIGSGEQYFSYITISDLVRAIIFLLENNAVRGPVNLSSPFNITQKEFAKILAKYFNKPLFLSIPKVFLKFFLGEFAEAIMSSCRVYPKKLQDHGFEFKENDLLEYLKKIKV